MGILNNISKVFADYFLSKAPDGDILVEAAKRSTGGRSESPYRQLQLLPKSIQAKTLQQWKMAVSAATDPDNPDRTALAELYENLMLDNHLASVIDSRILFAQRSAFKFVDAKGNENKEISMLFERPWFEELIYLVLFSRFQGTTLIEIFETNPEGEIAEINEIPQPWFNPILGIITKNPGEQIGWDYKNGPLSRFYVQVGKPKSIGMFEKLAVIVLAKKLGMGSWLDYIEKYGIPPLFITTERGDTTRLNELYDAAKNFKSNHFMIGGASESFELGQAQGTAATDPFGNLLKRGDEEISKRVLGGSGLTDEKAFVGSSEIQFRLAKDRFEADKMLFKNVFNAHIKPKLIAISEVYKPLENLTFDWDNTESLNQKEIIDAVSKLGSIYEIDEKYISEVTGIPILGTKSQIGNDTSFENKKRSESLKTQNNDLNDPGKK